MGIACFLGLFFLGGWHLHRSPPAADPSGPTRTCGRKAYKMGVSSRFVVNGVTWGNLKMALFYCGDNPTYGVHNLSYGGISYFTPFITIIGSHFCSD